MRLTSYILVIAGLFFALASEAQTKLVKKPSRKVAKLSAQEKMILDFTNAERAKEKLPPLKIDRKLMVAARKHSANMAKQGKFTHDLDDMGVDMRVEKEGYRYRSVAENIAMGSKGYSIKQIMKGWMDSEGHKQNILAKKYTEIGIGIATDGNGDVYYTQVFGRPVKK